MSLRVVALKPLCKRLPITPEILAALKRFWEAVSDQFNAATFWAASCTYVLFRLFAHG